MNYFSLVYRKKSYIIYEGCFNIDSGLTLRSSRVIFTTQVTTSLTNMCYNTSWWEVMVKIEKYDDLGQGIAKTENKICFVK